MRVSERKNEPERAPYDLHSILVQEEEENKKKRREGEREGKEIFGMKKGEE